MQSPVRSVKCHNQKKRFSMFRIDSEALKKDKISQLTVVIVFFHNVSMLKQLLPPIHPVKLV